MVKCPRSAQMIPNSRPQSLPAGIPQARDALARELRQIQETIGFYDVVSHGVPDDPIARGYDALC